MPLRTIFSWLSIAAMLGVAAIAAFPPGSLPYWLCPLAAVVAACLALAQLAPAMRRTAPFPGSGDPVPQLESITRKLVKSEATISLAVESSLMQVVDWDLASGRLAEGDILHNWLGLPSRLDRLDDVLCHIHADDRDGVVACIEKLRRDRERSECLFRFLLPDGSPRWILSRSQCLDPADGRPAWATCLLIDLTERYQSLERLQLLESAVVYARDAVIVLEDRPKESGGRRVLYVNAAFCEMTGYAANEVLGRSLHVLRGPNSDPATLEELRVALENGESYQGELLNYRKDGTEFWVELSLVPVPGRSGGSGYSHWVMIQRDASDRKQAEAELRHNREMLAESQRIAHIGSWEFSPGTLRCEWSDEKFRICGFQPGDFRPNELSYLAGVHPEDRDRVRDYFERIIRDNIAGRLSIEYRVLRPNGEIRHVVDEFYPEFEGDSPVASRYRGATQDITERRQAQEQLLQAQKMELVGRMAGGIAHDFNNMLTGLIGHIELLNIPPDDPNRKRVETIHGAAVRAMRISKNLLGLAERATSAGSRSRSGRSLRKSSNSCRARPTRGSKSLRTSRRRRGSLPIARSSIRSFSTSA